jgi:hypothetical protein
MEQKEAEGNEKVQKKERLLPKAEEAWRGVKEVSN